MSATTPALTASSATVYPEFHNLLRAPPRITKRFVEDSSPLADGAHPPCRIALSSVPQTRKAEECGRKTGK